MSAPFYRNFVTFLDSPDCMELRDADENNFARWHRLLTIAGRANNQDGSLTHRGKPWTAEQLAREHRDNPAHWGPFIDLCLELGLLLKSEDGTLSIADWEKDWFGKMPLTNAERQKAYRDRKKSKSTNETKKATQKNLPKPQNVTQSNAPPLQSNEPVLLSNDGTQRSNATEQSRAEHNITEHSRAEQQRYAQRNAPGILPADFSSQNFSENCSRLYEKISGKKLTQPDLDSLLSEMEKPGWGSHTAWRDRFGALLISASKTELEVQGGKQIGNPWWYTVKAAHDFLIQANQTNRVNDANVPKGRKAIPFGYSKPEGVA